MKLIKIMKCDLYRVCGGGNPLKHILFNPEFKYVACYRLTNYFLGHSALLKTVWRVILKSKSIKYGYEIAPECSIGPGLRLVHRGGVCIKPDAQIGNNATIFHGVTIGATRRGSKKGSPVIGDRVWIGSNATIVGNITVGDDVLIAPNTYINRDIPSHCICLGNPAKMIERADATEYYIDNICGNLEDD